MHEKDRPAESACDLIRNFWHDTKKYSENPANEIIDSDTGGPLIRRPLIGRISL